MASIDIIDSLRKKFNEPLQEFYNRRIIFWDDYDNEFNDIVDDIKIDNVEVIKLNGSNNFYVKKLVLHDKPNTNFLIYNPLNISIEQDWLFDIHEYSQNYKADRISNLIDDLGINDTLNNRKALKEYSKFFASKARVDKLRELNLDYSDSKSIHLGIIAVLSGVKEINISAFILNLFKNGFEDNKIINDIKNYGSYDNYNKLISNQVGCNCDNLNKLACSILISGLGQTMDSDILNNYYPNYFNKDYVINCYALINDLYTLDEKFTNEFIKDLGSNELKIADVLDKLDISKIANSDIFPHFNGCILKKVFKEICSEVIKSKENIDLINRRRRMRHYEEYKYYFEGIYYIALMQDMYSKLRSSFHMTSSKEIWNAYENDLYKFDTYYRKFHYYLNKSISDTNIHIDDSFKECADYIENIYKNWFLNNLLTNWNKAVLDELRQKGRPEGVLGQKSFYSNYVAKSAEEKITFVVICDALRYEVGKELYNELSKNEKAKVNISSMCSIFPSITEYGMAALLPGEKYVMDDVKKISIDGIDSGNVKNRSLILQKSNINSLAISYDEFVNSRKEERNELLKGKSIVYIYQNQIDMIGHGNEKQVFDACEETIQNISNLVTIINNTRSSCTIYITSDHGFLYNYKPLAELNKLSISDMDNVLSYSRRYVVTNKNSDNNYLSEVKMLINNSNDSLIGLAPLDIVRIKKGGSGENYVHGGISIEELMIPLIKYENIRTTSKEYQRNHDLYDKKNVELQLIDDSRKISNLNVSLKFLQKNPVGGTYLAANYEIYMQDSNNKVISDIKTIIADKTDEDTTNRQFKVMLSLKNREYDSKEKYYLLVVNKDSNDVILRIEYQISIAFSFGFDF